ncbi:MAG: DNA polymerase III subunit alpha, partial [Burkholderiales bacterium]
MNPANPVTLPQAIAAEPRLQEARDAEPIVAKLLDIGQRLEGLYRHASTHAAGVVIADRPLSDLVPLYRDSRAQLPATQFSMKWAEAAGLVKFDFLGLKTLTVIETARKLIARRGIEINPAKLPLDDAATYALLQKGDTVGVFQLEGQGMRDALRKLKPDRFEDIIAIVALYRPGPMDNIDSYVNRKHGREGIETLHPTIEPILTETHGVIIYQEQVMQIAQVLSGFTLGEADLLRRAMGKKIKKEMAQQRNRFIEGAVGKGVDRARAEFIFELVAKFAGYGFNKSHAAAYALIAYQTAYLKANHPVEFLAASMTLDIGNTDKLNGFAQEARRMGIGIEPPSVNYSEAGFMPSETGIRYSLAALRNVGRQAVDHICAEREKRGRFKDLSAFARA